MRELHVNATALFSPGFDDLNAFLSGRADPAIKAPRDVLPPRARRGASLVTRMLADVADRATTLAGFDPKTVRTIYASAYGEVETALSLLKMQHDGDGQLSPHRFHTSVHNTASGLVSIANGNRSFSTAIAGGDQTVAIALLEAAALFHEEPGPIVVAIADEPIPPELGSIHKYPPLAVAFAFSDDPANAIARIDLSTATEAERARIPAPTLDPTYASCPVCPALQLARAIVNATATRIYVDPLKIAIDPPRVKMPAYPAMVDLVPHRPPMVLLDEALEYEAGKRLVCRVVIREDSPFVEDGRVGGIVALEYMAQCIAASVGIRGRDRGEGVQMGYLIGAREVNTAVDYFYVGDELRIESTHAWGDEMLGVFACTVERGGEVVASATLNVYRGDLKQVDSLAT